MSASVRAWRTSAGIVRTIIAIMMTMLLVIPGLAVALSQRLP